MPAFASRFEYGMTGEALDPALPFATGAAAEDTAYATPAFWRRQSIEQGKRHGWWPEYPRDALAALAGWLGIAHQLISHLAQRMGWSAGHYQGFSCLEAAGHHQAFACLDALAPAGNGPADGPMFEPTAPAQHLAETLAACALIPRGRLLAMLAADAQRPPEQILVALGNALRRRGRMFEAARAFDAALGVIQTPLPETLELSEEPITVVDDYRHHRILFDGRRFRGDYLGGDRHHRRSYPAPVADRFTDVVAMIDTAMPESRGRD